MVIIPMIMANMATADIDRYTDGHVHSRLCHHGFGEMEEYVLAAIDKGLTSLIFLEHFEVAISYFEVTWLTADDFSYYRAEGKRLHEKYKDVITVETGAEVGFNPQCIDEIQSFIKSEPWARVGLSYHFMPVAGEEHINMLSRKHANIERINEYGGERLLTAYYEGLLLAVQSIDADVVCHLDAGLRHAKSIAYQDVHWQLIAKILDVMVVRKMGLEINTSGLSVRGESFPCQRIIDMANERNLQMVLGSDAHKPEQVGRGFDLV